MTEARLSTTGEVPVELLRNVLALLGQHYQRNPTWHGDRMCICGSAPFPCNYAQARDKITEAIGG